MTEFHSFSRRERATVAAWFLIGAFLILLGAFFRAQVLQHERFKLRAEKNRLRLVPLAAPRGMIFDRNGAIIADNVPGYSIKLLAPSEDSLRAVLRRVASVVPLDSSQMALVVRRYRLGARGVLVRR